MERDPPSAYPGPERVVVTEAVLANEPEKLLPEIAENRWRLFHALGLVTKPSSVQGADGTVRRPLRQRHERATQLARFRATDDRAERAGIIDEARRKERVVKDYLTQGRIELSFPDLGRVSAAYAVMRPPTPDAPKEPPIVLLAGLSNAGASVAQIADELAMSGRTVVLLPQPESAMAKVEEPFAEAVAASGDFTPHARYFRALIDALGEERVPELKDTMDVWAYSASCPEIARACADESFSRRVREAVFVCPAGASDVDHVAVRAVSQFLGMFAPNRNLPAAPIAWGRTAPETKQDEALRTRIRDALAPSLAKRSDVWTRMTVGDGAAGNAIVVAYDGDYLGSGAHNMLEPGGMLPNTQMKLVRMRGTHPTPTMPGGAKELIAAVRAAREGSRDDRRDVRA